MSAAAARNDLVVAYGDGIPHTPEQYSQLLAKLTAGGTITSDSYSRGGVVEQLESRMAEALGKETAVWLPTGTLANHLAVRLLAGAKRRVLVQADSHLYNDCGDCAQTLSGLNLVGLAPGKATFTLDEVRNAVEDSMQGRVATPVGAIQIESPVRRHDGARFDFDEMRKISAWARGKGIGIHLDGARLYLESAYTGHSVKEYAALFDTVYISMYKYFNSGSGAILAGPKALLDGLYHTRRMFGGGLPHVWMFAAVALNFIDGFDARFRRAVETSEAAIARLQSFGNFTLQRVPGGTNIFRLRIADVNTQVYHGRLENAGILAQAPSGNEWLTLQVNETWNRVPAEEIARRFHQALG
jgi:threonine aldolase